jgi:hypothetical protein
LDGSIALVEFSKPSRSACVKTFEYAHIEVGLKIWFPHRQAKWLGAPGIHITRASIDHLFVDLSQQAAKLKRRAAEKAAGGH